MRVSTTLVIYHIMPPSALVTGVVSGIGYDLVLNGLSGYNLTLIDIDESGLQRTAEAIRTAHSTTGSALQVCCHVMDVRDEKKLAAVVAEHVRQFGGLDLAVLNAGIGEKGPLFQPGSDSWSLTLQVDLEAVIAGTRVTTMAMMQHGGTGTIICVASAGGLYPMQASPVYAAAKAGVVHFTRSAGPVLRRQGIRLIAVCPEFVDTPLVRKVMNEDPQAAKRLLGSLDIKLLPPSAVTQLTMQLLNNAQEFKGGDIALLRQDGSIQFPFQKSAAATKLSGKNGSVVVSDSMRNALKTWATTRLPTQYEKIQVHTLSSEFRKATRFVSAPMPDAGQLPAGTLLVKRVFVGINASDINFTSGRYHASKREAASKLPFDCGFESVSVVVAAAPGVQGFVAGDCVASLTQDGFSEYGILPVSHALRVPHPSAQVVALLTSGLTASIALEQCGGPCFAAGKTVLVTAAAGGTGQFAVSLAVRAGMHVIATAGGADKAALLKRLGAHRVVNYKTDDLKAVLKAEYPNGIDLVFESVGGAMFSTALDALASGGRLIIIGMMSQYQEGWPVSSHPGLAEKLLWKSASVHGFFLLRHARLWRAHLDKLLPLAESGQLPVMLDPTGFVGLHQVPDAVGHLQSGNSMGKVVVQVCKELPPGVEPAGPSSRISELMPISRL